MSKLIDITRTVQDAPLYPGSSPIRVERVVDMKQGALFNVSKITTGSHIGTHADAGCHFLADNNTGIDKMELHRYYGPCCVVTVPEKSLITRAMLEGKIDNCQRLVINSSGSSYLAKDGAEYIVEKGVLTVVTDAWSIGPMDNEPEIHTIIMSAGLAVVENVVLDGVADGEYILSAFPIKIGGCDGAPVRAVLIAT